MTALLPLLLEAAMKHRKEATASPVVVNVYYAPPPIPQTAIPVPPVVVPP